MEQPLFERLKEYDKTMLPMHMPGHKRNLALSGEGGYLAALCADCDITEIAGFDNLAEPEEILLSVKNRAAKLWKSDEAYPLVNGSTCGILAGIYATVSNGGKVIVARNCHKSVYNGLQLVNAQVSYLIPDWNKELGCYESVSSHAVEEALEATPDAELMIITSPTYEGVMSDITEICRIAHEKGVPVLVDSAHGAHLGFGIFPKNAVDCGADLVVRSLHKTLPSLTQTAMLHRTGKLVSGEKVQAAINMFQTSSPSYLLLASIEGCIGLLESRGEELFAGWEKALWAFYIRTVEMRHLSVWINIKSGGELLQDQGKLVISVAGTNLTGPELMNRLREEYHIELEMAAEQYAIAMTGMGDTEETLSRLVDALTEIDATCEIAPEMEMMSPALPVIGWPIGEVMSAVAGLEVISYTSGNLANAVVTIS